MEGGGRATRTSERLASQAYTGVSAENDLPFPSVSLADITAAEITRAIREADRLGRERFRETYGFDAARRYVLVHDGIEYDSKAIVGVAHGYLPGQEPLSAAAFSGGRQGAARVLARLGFHVVDQRDRSSAGEDLVTLARRLAAADRGLGEFAPDGAVALLWVVGRARRGGPRLLPWAETDQAIRRLAERHGARRDDPRADAAVVALFRAGVWDLPGQVGAVPRARADAGLRQWFVDNQPRSGLLARHHALVRASGQSRLEVVDTLITARFGGDGGDALAWRAQGCAGRELHGCEPR